MRGARGALNSSQPLVGARSLERPRLLSARAARRWFGRRLAPGILSVRTADMLQAERDVGCTLGKAVPTHVTRGV